MSALALLAALSMTAAAPSASSDDILVVAERWKRIQVQVGRDARGRWTCGMQGSSGVTSLDGQLCRAVTDCVRKGATAQAAIQQCITTSKASLLARVEREWHERHD